MVSSRDRTDKRFVDLRRTCQAIEKGETESLNNSVKEKYSNKKVEGEAANEGLKFDFSSLNETRIKKDSEYVRI